MAHKAGFVNIVGNPNVGKSTLMNLLVGEQLSIITSKSQTTRHRIKGIVNGDDYQIVFSDTPGVLKPSYKLQTAMLTYSRSAISDADILLYVTDVYEKFDKNEDFFEKVIASEKPLIVLINKIDLSTQEKVLELAEKWKVRCPNAELLFISALNNFNVDSFKQRLIELLPESAPFYGKDELTDRSERFFVAEKIREKILTNYTKEVPYSVEVVVDEFKEEENIIRIRAIIYVERESQKKIIIGLKGESIKKVGIESRLDLEVFFDKKVFLQTHVKVEKDWRNKQGKIEKFGYDH